MSGFSQLSSFYKLYGLKVGATPCDSPSLVFGCLAASPAVPLCFRQVVISFDCISVTASRQSMARAIIVSIALSHCQLRIMESGRL